MLDTAKKLLCCLLRFSIVQLHYIFDCIIDFVFGLYYDGKEKKIPPVKNQIILESAVDLAEKIR